MRRLSSLIVPRPVQYVHRVRQQGRNGFEGLDRALRTSWKVDDEHFAPHHCRAARKHRCRRVVQALAPHLFGDSGHDPVSHRLRRFRGVIPRPDPGSTRSQEKVHAAGIRQFSQLLADVCGIVRHTQRRGHFPSQPAAGGHNRGPGQVLAFAICYGIADGENRYAHREGFFKKITTCPRRRDWPRPSGASLPSAVRWCFSWWSSALTHSRR